MLEKDDYKNLAAHFKKTAVDLKKELSDESGSSLDIESHQHTLRSTARQLEVLMYDPMLVETYLDQYDVPMDILRLPLKEMPLHVNADNIIVSTIVKWRFSQGV